MATKLAFHERFLNAWRSAKLWNVTLLAAALVLAAVILIGFFSPFGISVFDDAGSTADWVAAVGTWIIGMGAIRFAASDHAMKISDRRQARIDALTAEVEDVERVARNARYASDELRGSLEALEEAFDVVHMLGRKPRATLMHVYRAGNLLCWLPSQLRLLSEAGTTQAETVDMAGQRLVGLSGRIEEAPGEQAMVKLVGELKAGVEALLPKLEELAITAGKDAKLIGKRLDELQNQADLEVVAKR